MKNDVVYDNKDYDRIKLSEVEMGIPFRIGDGGLFVKVGENKLFCFERNELIEHTDKDIFVDRVRYVHLRIQTIEGYDYVAL